MIKGAGLLTPTCSYQLDHLAIIYIIMDVPLLCLEDNDLELANKYYPQLKTLKVDYSTFTPEALVSTYDVIFTSEITNQQTAARLRELEKQYGKKLHQVFCPHGFSDKVFYFKQCVSEDVLLVYGQSMLDLFQSEKLLSSLHSYVVVGNYRYNYYKENKEFYDDLAQREVWNQFAEVKNKKMIFYAPTWADKENSTTFFDATSILIDQLPSDCNLLIKLHPRLELSDTATYYQLIGKYEHRKDVVFLNTYPPIYPLLERADIYLGDMSSIGYDYLVFNRPMFFLDKVEANPENRYHYLHRCGVSVPPNQYPEIYNIIENHKENESWSKIREETYKYTFAENISFSSIRKAISLSIK